MSEAESIVQGDPADEVEYRLRYYGDEGLKRQAQQVREITPAIAELFRTLERIAIAKKGLGLAANQVGSNAAVAVMKVGEEWLRLINPFIVRHGEEGAEKVEYHRMPEGSLSIPGFQVGVTRSRRVLLAYQNEQLEDCQRELVDLQARCAQHLVDQLNGIMIVGPWSSRQVKRQAERIATKARGWS